MNRKELKEKIDMLTERNIQLETLLGHYEYSNILLSNGNHAALVLTRRPQKKKDIICLKNWLDLIFDVYQEDIEQGVYKKQSYPG